MQETCQRFLLSEEIWDYCATTVQRFLGEILEKIAAWWFFDSRRFLFGGGGLRPGTPDYLYSCISDRRKRVKMDWDCNRQYS